MPNLPRCPFEFDGGGHRPRLPWRRRNARVAAAQAVIAVCLELPLESVDILVRAQPLSDGEIDLDGGRANLRPGSTDEWLSALPDVEAADNLLLFAIMTGGLCAALSLGHESEIYEARGDAAIFDMYAIAEVLGLGGPGTPASHAWIMERLREALGLLVISPRSWERVSAALLTRVTLSGDEVRALVLTSGDEWPRLQ